MKDEAFDVEIDFQASFFDAILLNVNHSGIHRNPLRTTHQKTPDGNETFQPSDIKDYGQMEIEFQFDSSKTPPVDEPAENIVVTFPLGEGEATRATWEFEGFMTDYEYTGTLGEMFTGRATLKVSGGITITPAT
jgi:hypothetical protein